MVSPLQYVKNKNTFSNKKEIYQMKMCWAVWWYSRKITKVEIWSPEFCSCIMTLSKLLPLFGPRFPPFVK